MRKLFFTIAAGILVLYGLSVKGMLPAAFTQALLQSSFAKPPTDTVIEGNERVTYEVSGSSKQAVSRAPMGRGTPEAYKKYAIAATYTNPQGLVYESYDAGWTADKLKVLDSYLQQFPKGAEYERLAAVRVTPESSDWAGLFKYRTVSQSNGMHVENGSVIYLFNAHTIQNPLDYGGTLAHEYGHLFTNYWLAEKEGKHTDDPATGWAKLRGFTSSMPVRWSGSGLGSSHAWTPAEIMADDYMQMAAPPAFRARLNRTGTSGYDFTYLDSVENQALPPIETLPAVAAYWKKLSGVTISSKSAMPASSLTGISAYDKPVSPKYPYFTERVLRVSFTNLGSGMEYAVRMGDENAMAYNGGHTDLSNTRSGVTSIEYGIKSVNTSNRTYVKDWIPSGKGYVQILAYNPATGQMTYSQLYPYDFSSPYHPVAVK
ncbi:hypothetical protein [Ectobacillus ponti]|uniref:Uncharacterized protein n=1 Tax=Ectobacillus ponti TaxID=2961894 RepID=A0AA41XAH6_9BACI|nr:hypothetical protein [Ectobacillus ponti]MCP8970143.1 hypothetical protein [Ectobacillus ponti]